MKKQNPRSKKVVTEPKKTIKPVSNEKLKEIVGGWTEVDNFIPTGHH